MQQDLRVEIVARVSRSAVHVLERGPAGIVERRSVLPTGLVERFGETTPWSLHDGGTTATELLTTTLTATVARPLAGIRILVICPDVWRSRQRDLICATLHDRGAKVRACPESGLLLEDMAPDPGQRVAFVRAGSTQTSAQIVEWQGDGWRVLQKASTPWGGKDLDEALARFVQPRVPDQVAAPELVAACKTAREQLSSAEQADVVTSLATVSVQRSQLDALTVPAATRALRTTLGEVLEAGGENQQLIDVRLSGGLAALDCLTTVAARIADRAVHVVDWRQAAERHLATGTAPAAGAGHRAAPARAVPTTAPVIERILGRLQRAHIVAFVAGALALLALATTAIVLTLGASVPPVELQEPVDKSTPGPVVAGRDTTNPGPDARPDTLEPTGPESQPSTPAGTPAGPPARASAPPPSPNPDRRASAPPDDARPAGARIPQPVQTSTRPPAQVRTTVPAPDKTSAPPQSQAPRQAAPVTTAPGPTVTNDYVPNAATEA